MAPKYISSLLSGGSPVRSLRPSGTRHLNVPRTKSPGEGALSHYGAVLWDKLVDDLRSAATVSS